MMDKEKILAAKKKLKEYQRNQKAQNLQKEQVSSDQQSSSVVKNGMDDSQSESNDYPLFTSFSDNTQGQHNLNTFEGQNQDETLRQENLYFKRLVESLQQELSFSKNRISELERGETEKLQAYGQTTEILVLEKAELLKNVAHYESVIEQKTGEVADLYAKLKAANNRNDYLEKELELVQTDKASFEKYSSELEKSCQSLNEACNNLRKENENLTLEKSELIQKLELKNNELLSVQEELQQKAALLSLSELRLQQVSNSPQPDIALQQDHQTTVMLNQELAQAKEALKLVNQEKDEAARQYQNYVQQLDEKLAQLSTELESSKKNISESKIREQSYVERLSDLEIQLQREKNKPTKSEEDKHSEKIETLTKTIDSLVSEQEKLQSLVSEKDKEIEALRKSLQELQDIKEQSANALKLMEALQGEQLGASRAVSQNKELKKQLEEMHDAFIQLSNTKLDLTEQLQAERVIGRKLNGRLNEMEQQIGELNVKLDEKNQTLIDLEKDKISVAQIQDQMQHYQATSHNASTLQDEIQKAKIIIENLKKENKHLREQVNSLSESPGEKEEPSSTSDSKEENLVDTKSVELKTSNDSANNIETISEALKKLEIKFKESMERVADLTDEKQRLEHLVLQLQGETETIGEYVTLYQKQRAILQERARDKERIYRQILDQRNSLQEQLHKLKLLVADLLKPKPNAPPVPVATEMQESTTLTDNDVETNNVETKDVSKSPEYLAKRDHTESRILDLLSEIKDCNDACILEPNFHPCPWCSGKLITV